jgi:methylphosphotriester-DNA--protein-cysteine methyltransferase
MSYKILKAGYIVESHIPGNYAGHRPLKIFGRLNCASGKRFMEKENRVFFHTLEDAVREGYRPCMKCRPLDEKEFQRIKRLTPYNNLEEFYRRDQKKK